MKSKMILSILISFITFLTFAGQERGGGSSVVCFNASTERLDGIDTLIQKGDISEIEDQEIESVTTLDVYLSSQSPRSTIHSLNKDFDNSFDIIDSKLDELKSFQSNLGQILQDRMSATKSNLIWTSLKVLASDDADLQFVLPKNCRLIYIARHIYSAQADYSHIYIQQRLFEKMTPASQAALLLHEFLMPRTLDLDGQSTLRLQYIVDLILSRELKNFDSKFLNNFLVSHGFQFELQNNGIKIVSHSVHFENHYIKINVETQDPIVFEQEIVFQSNQQVFRLKKFSDEDWYTFGDKNWGQIETKKIELLIDLAKAPENFIKLISASNFKVELEEYSNDRQFPLFIKE